MNRPSAIVALAAAVLMVAGCAPGLPNTVISGSEVRIGWHGSFTSTNASSVAGATPGNIDVAALTRGTFMTPTAIGMNVTDGFGTVTLEGHEPYVVRYDLAETAWSDGVPVDAADLMLAWAAGSNAVSSEGFDTAANRAEDGTLSVPDGVAWFDSVRTDLIHSTEIPEYDEFERRIDVTFDEPVVHWQTALNISVPAHVVGMEAFGITDPMAAKLRVIRAIASSNESDLAAIAEVWNEGFGVSPGDSPEQLLSSGPYRITSFNADGVTMAVNTRYGASLTSTFQTVELVGISTDQTLGAIGSDIDVAQFAPSDDLFVPIRDLERQDYGRYVSNDGTVWAMSLRVDRGVFQSLGARWSFLHGAPRDDMTSAGAGQWSSDFQPTTSVLFQTGTTGFEMSTQDAGFNAAYAESGADAAAAQRTAAGVAAGTGVCVLFDRDSTFATRAFEALRTEEAEAGWTVQDCGTNDMAAGLAQTNWDAVITTIPIPTSPEEVRDLWGSTASQSLSGSADPERDLLIDAYEVAGDDDNMYTANQALVQVEASIINAAVVLPLSVNPIITVTAPYITGVAPLNGPSSSLMPGVVSWSMPQ